MVPMLPFMPTMLPVVLTMQLFMVSMLPMQISKVTMLCLHCGEAAIDGDNAAAVQCNYARRRC